MCHLYKKFKLKVKIKGGKFLFALSSMGGGGEKRKRILDTGVIKGPILRNR